MELPTVILPNYLTNLLREEIEAMKYWMKRGIITLSLLGLALALPVVSGCQKSQERPDHKADPDFVDTSDPTSLKMPSLSGGNSGGALKEAPAKK